MTSESPREATGGIDLAGRPASKRIPRRSDIANAARHAGTLPATSTTTGLAEAQRSDIHTAARRARAVEQVAACVVVAVAVMAGLVLLVDRLAVAPALLLLGGEVL